jgi:hypothetical protein
MASASAIHKRPLAATDDRRLGSTRASRSALHHLARLGVVVALVVCAALYAESARADEAAAPEGTVDVTSSSDTTASSDPAAPSTEQQGSSGDLSSPVDADGSAGTVTEPQPVPTGGEVAPAPSDDGVPATDPAAPGDAAGEPATDGSGADPAPTEPAPTEPVPATEPTEPVADVSNPPTTGDPSSSEGPVKPPLGGKAGIGVIPFDTGIATPIDLHLLAVGGAQTTKDRDRRVAGSDARSTKSQSVRRSLPSPGSPASSPSPGASGAAGAGGSSGGVGLAVEFLLAALVILRYTCRASFTLPDSLAFALREERPG